MNRVKFFKESDKAIDPVSITNMNNMFDIFANDIAISEANDSMAIFTYKTDITVNIPYGCIGVITPNKTLEQTSLFMVNEQCIVGDNNVLEFKYKSISNVKPVIYKPTDAVARLTILTCDAADRFDIINRFPSDDSAETANESSVEVVTRDSKVEEENGKAGVSAA